MPVEFIQFGIQSVNLAYIVRADWKVASAGRTANIHVYLYDGHQLCCPYTDPQTKRFAELLGFGEVYAAWPAQKKKADDALTKKQADEKARLEMRRRGQFVNS